MDTSGGGTYAPVYTGSSGTGISTDTGGSVGSGSSGTGTGRDTGASTSTGGGSVDTGSSVYTSSNSTGTSTGTGGSTSTSSSGTGTSSSTATSAGGTHAGGSADTSNSRTGTSTDTGDTSMNTSGSMDTGGSGTDPHGSVATSGSGMDTGGSGMSTGGSMATSSSSMNTSGSMATSGSSTSTGGSMDTGGSGTSTGGSGMSTGGSMATSSSSMNTSGSMDTGGSSMSTSVNMATSGSSTNTSGSMATSSSSTSTGGSMDTGGSGMSTGGSMATSGSGTNTSGTTTTDGTDEAEWASCLPPGALSALRYRRGSLSILDQRLLPAEVRYEAVRDVERARAAIASMEVRGAPAIALVGCLALAVELWAGGGPSVPEGGAAEALAAFVDERLRRLEGARPTGSNMQREAQRLRELVRGRLQERPPPGEAQLRESIIEHLEGLLRRDVAQNRSIGAHGARHILGRVPPGSAVTLLTHCNTGGLATAGYGTALGIVWALHAQGRVARVFCTETRPCNQGARLTALELLRAGVPATLITDSAAATAIRDRGVQAVVVGADRVAANGDTANKVGTYPLALAARQHGVPLYVAAPSASCDPALPSGGQLPLEERPGTELGAAPGIDVWNPAFDVTPHELITGGIVTEWGVFAPSQLRAALEAHGEL